jgi:hypothetical protein
MRKIALLLGGTLLLAVAGALGPAAAADFAQAERDVDFIRACRRQDRELRKYFGDMIQPGARFFHLGSFKALIHRDGLDRSLWLIPLKTLPYAGAEDFRSAANGNPLAVGALIVTYPHDDPRLTPGTHLLTYDGLSTSFLDAHEYRVNSIISSLGPAPAENELDPALGTVTGTAFSQANITPEGDLELYLQLADEQGNPLMDDSGFVKVLLSIPMPGIATDDESAYRELAVPPEEEE